MSSTPITGELSPPFSKATVAELALEATPLLQAEKPSYILLAAPPVKNGVDTPTRLYRGSASNGLHVYDKSARCH